MIFTSDPTISEVRAADKNMKSKRLDNVLRSNYSSPPNLPSGKLLLPQAKQEISLNRWMLEKSSLRLRLGPVYGLRLTFPFFCASAGQRMKTLPQNHARTKTRTHLSADLDGLVSKAVCLERREGPESSSSLLSADWQVRLQQLRQSRQNTTSYEPQSSAGL